MNFITGFILATAFWAVADYVYYIPRAVKAGEEVGIAAGQSDYHKRCYSIGGLMVDEKTMTGVLCRGVGKIEERELGNFLKTRSM